MCDPPQRSQSARPHHQHHHTTASASPTSPPQRPHRSMAGGFTRLTVTDQVFSIDRRAPAAVRPPAAEEPERAFGRRGGSRQEERRATRVVPRATRNRRTDAAPTIRYLSEVPGCDRGATPESLRTRRWLLSLITRPIEVITMDRLSKERSWAPNRAAAHPKGPKRGRHDIGVVLGRRS